MTMVSSSYVMNHNLNPLLYIYIKKKNKKKKKKEEEEENMPWLFYLMGSPTNFEC